MSEEKKIKTVEKVSLTFALYFSGLSRKERLQLLRSGWCLSDKEMSSIEPIGLYAKEFIIINN